MRKLNVYEFITLDGVIQGPGGLEEDTSGGFTHGGWTASYGDEELNKYLGPELAKPFDLLLGRKTFKIFESYWPLHADMWPGSMTATKYVGSNTVNSSTWQPSVFLNGDLAAKVSALKQHPGPDLQTWGSANMLQTLLKADLVDTLFLMIYPLTLGYGKRLFGEGTIPAAFTLKESHATPKGVIIAIYERDGAVVTGTVA